MANFYVGELTSPAAVLWAAVIAAIPATVIALANLVTAMRTGRKLDTANVKADALKQTAEVIHENTNSTLTDIRSDLADARQKIESLEKTAREMTAKHLTLMERLLTDQQKKSTNLRLEQD